jgi:DNA-binding transcriptional ArsR family regulator
MTAEPHIHLTSEMVQALAHPLRMRMLGILRVEGPATATDLARRCETNTGATSYHLRQLAKVGLVEEDERPEGGRRRWWKASQSSMSWRDTEHDDDPKARTASDWLVRSLHRTYGTWVDSWLDARDRWPKEWRDAADQSDFVVTATPDRLVELNKRVHQLIIEFGQERHEGEQVAIVYYSFPERVIER